MAGLRKERAMSAADHEVVRESWALFQVSVEGVEELEISVLPGSVPARGASRTMFLVTNRYRRKVLGLKAEAKLLEADSKLRMGTVKFRQTSLLPGEVSFGTIEIAATGAVPGEHGIGLAVSYHLASAEPVRSAAV
jgi:hypothetical protein